MNIHIIVNHYREITTGNYVSRTVCGKTFEEACDLAIRAAEKDEASRKLLLVMRSNKTREVSHETL